MLFSEPKIPQLHVDLLAAESPRTTFSALQRAENSSMVQVLTHQQSLGYLSVLFSEPKIPQLSCCRRASACLMTFSALQRAENSSIAYTPVLIDRLCSFQCSSASRKFLNSAKCGYCLISAHLSVLFSEPKIPQSDQRPLASRRPVLSVLFSEPKIPQ